MSGFSLFGVNLSGAEYDPGGTQEGTNYTYPTDAEIDYYASKGMTVIRLPFLLERVEPVAGGPLSATELGYIDNVVNYAASKGIDVILDPHDFGDEYGTVIGSTAASNATFANFWGELASHFASTSNVLFGLMNEPNAVTPTQWLASANAAIAAIRSAGATTQQILVPGTDWDGADTWVSSGNAQVLGSGIVDPSHNFAFEVHQYLDANGSGTSSTVVSTTIGVERLTAITEWAEATGNKLFLGEFGVASDPTSLTALNNMLGYMAQHTDVWEGGTYWAAGAWWGNYMYSVEPTNGVDKPQMGVLDQYVQKTIEADGSTSHAAATAKWQSSPYDLNDFSWASGWTNDSSNPREVVQLNDSGTAAYVGFGASDTIMALGGTFASASNRNGPGFSDVFAAVHDFGTQEGYKAAAQRGAALTGYGPSATIYGQGYQGIYWYGANGSTIAPNDDGTVPTYETSPHLYGQFGTQQGWTVNNGFDVVKAQATDSYASILGFGNSGIIVGPQAFAPGASASQSYLIPLPTGNNNGWDQAVDVRTFQDANGGMIDLNHDGITDFVGMGPQGLVFAYGTEDASGHYSLGQLQIADLGGGANLGRAQGWTDANALREVVHDDLTGYDDIIAFGAPGVFVAMGQAPSTHNGQPFGPMYLAMSDMGTNQGWSNAMTPRLVGDVNGDGNPDIVGFGADNTFTAVGSRDVHGLLQFMMDPSLTIHNYGYNEGWSTSNTVRTLADVDGSGQQSLVLSGAFGTSTLKLA